MSENINREIYTELANRIYDLDGEVYRCSGIFSWTYVYRKP